MRNLLCGENEPQKLPLLVSKLYTSFPGSVHFVLLNTQMGTVLYSRMFYVIFQFFFAQIKFVTLYGSSHEVLTLLIVSLLQFSGG